MDEKLQEIKQLWLDGFFIDNPNAWDINDKLETLFDALRQKEEDITNKNLMVDAMLKSFDSIAKTAEDEKTREYASRIAKSNRDFLDRLKDLPKASESTALLSEAEADSGL